MTGGQPCTVSPLLVATTIPARAGGYEYPPHPRDERRRGSPRGGRGCFRRVRAIASQTVQPRVTGTGRAAPRGAGGPSPGVPGGAGPGGGAPPGERGAVRGGRRAPPRDGRPVAPRAIGPAPPGRRTPPIRRRRRGVRGGRLARDPGSGGA